MVSFKAAHGVKEASPKPRSNVIRILLMQDRRRESRVVWHEQRHHRAPPTLRRPGSARGESISSRASLWGHGPAFLVFICHRRAVLLKMAVPAVRLRVVGLQVQGAPVRVGAGG
jgi:hypothetical protein